MKLSTRFAVCVAVLVPLLVGLSGLLVLRFAVDDLHTERDRRLTVRLQALVPVASTYAARPRKRPGGPAEQRIIDAALDDGTGGMIIQFPGDAPVSAGTVPAGLPPVAQQPTTTADGLWRYSSIALKGKTGRLWIFEPEAQLADRVDQLRGRLLLATLLAALVGAAAGFGLGRFAVTPLTRLRGQAKRLDLEHAGGRFSTTSGVAEIDELAVLVNDLLERRDRAVVRTAEALETARAFAATAAHELRTPMTSLSANIGLLSHPDLSDQDRNELIEDLVAEQARMHRLITMLRQLARGELLDADAFAELDFAALVAQAVDDARRRHPHATIITALPDQATLRGWTEGLRLIVDNLLDNASIHGTDDTGAAQIRVNLRATPDKVTLLVRDHGHGIPQDRQTQVFDRFSRRADSPGSGLGMTLIQQQAVLHGGKVAIEQARPGATLRVELPTGIPSPTRDDAHTWLTTTAPDPLRWQAELEKARRDS